MYSVSARAQTHTGMSGCQTVVHPARAEGRGQARGDMGSEGSWEPPALLVSGVSWGRSLPRPLSVSAVRIK